MQMMQQLSEIGKKLNLSKKTIVQRFNKLLKRSIIRGFKAKINSTCLKEFYPILVESKFSYTNYDSSILSIMTRFGVTRLNLVSGEWNLNFILEFPDLENVLTFNKKYNQIPGVKTNRIVAILKSWEKIPI